MIKKALQYFLNFLASMNLAVFVLSAIAALIILQAAGGKLITIFTHWKWLNVIASKDFFHSQGFNFLLILFCVNLIACSIKRLPMTIAVLKSASRNLNQDLIDSLPLVEKVKLDSSIESSEKFSSAIADHFKAPNFVKKENGQISLFAEKGRYTHIGFYLAHVSILVIVLGVLLSTKGFEYSFNITKDQVLDPLQIRDHMGIMQDLDFSLFCEDLKTVYYQKTSKVQKHQSTLSILKHGKKVITQDIDFSHPLRFEGVDIYQERYNRKIKYAGIRIVAKDGASQVVEVRSGGSFMPKNSGINIRTMRFRANSVQLRTGSAPERIWVSKKPVRFSANALEGYQFSLIDIANKEATRLKVVRDPGGQLIWYATFCMLAGFAIVFFLPHRQIWLKVEQKEEGCLLTLAGATTKDLPSFEEKFKQLVESLKGMV